MNLVYLSPSLSVCAVTMTSFIIKAHEGRDVPASWQGHPECPFCRILQGDAPAFKVYEDDKVIAILGLSSSHEEMVLVLSDM